MPHATKKDIELTWGNANAWATLANAEKETYKEPEWSWDCGFKLDFDGSLLTVSSRFYPPHKNPDGMGWNGFVNVLFLGKEVIRKEFTRETLDELKKDVEEFTANYTKEVEKYFAPMQPIE